MSARRPPVEGERAICGGISQLTSDRRGGTEPETTSETFVARARREPDRTAHDRANARPPNSVDVYWRNLVSRVGIELTTRRLRERLVLVQRCPLGSLALESPEFPS